MEARWQRWAGQTRAWGPPGNERLTTSVGLVLLVLLGIETLTTLALSSYLPEHIFLGLLLIRPVALKLTSTGWRSSATTRTTGHIGARGRPGCSCG
jgi:hypothetical protein